MNESVMLVNGEKTHNFCKLESGTNESVRIALGGYSFTAWVKYQIQLHQQKKN